MTPAAKTKYRPWPHPLTYPWRFLKRCARFRKELRAGKFDRGFCPVCKSGTLFVSLGATIREDYVCFFCLSKPRWRALIQAIETEAPRWRSLAIHESSPYGPASEKLEAECPGYTKSHYFPGIKPGDSYEGIRCEDLENLTWPDNSFDLIVTQDVMEHIIDPARAFGEIARVLKPGGMHVFTIPYAPDQPSVVRVRRQSDGQLLHLKPKAFHGNPIEGEGSLVITEWGNDLVHFIRQHSGLPTAVFRQQDPKLGLLGESLEVFLTKKPAPPAHT